MKIDAVCLQLSSSKGQDIGVWAFGVSLPNAICSLSLFNHNNFD